MIKLCPSLPLYTFLKIMPQQTTKKYNKLNEALKKKFKTRNHKMS